MALTRGILASVILGHVRTEVQDTGSAPRWSDAQILLYINDAFRDLATAKCFRRVDVIKPTASQATIQPLLEAEMVFGVWYEGQRLAARTPAEIERIHGSRWASLTGTPADYVAGETIRLVPRPPSAGAALTFGTAPITEADGKGPSGQGYWSALNASTVQHWLPGDGTASGEDGAGLVWIDYAYIPNDVTGTMYVPRRFSLAVRDFAVGMCLEKSEDPGEQRLRDRALSRYMEAKDGFATGTKWTAEHLPMMAANQDGWAVPYHFNALEG